MDQGGASRRRWPGVSTPGSALGGPPGAHAGPLTLAQIDTGQVQRSPSSSLPIVQLAATVSRSPFGVARDSAPPNLDTATTHQDLGACEKDGQR
jgi:hypothetical protein